MVRTKQTSGNSKNPFRKNSSKTKKATGKRIGKSKIEKANNQLNRRLK